MKDGSGYIVLAATLFAFAFSVEAQQVGDKIPLIGYLANNAGNTYSREAFRRGLIP